MKVIVFLILDNGIDGREKTTEVFASENEAERDNLYEKAVNKDYWKKDEKIVDMEVAKKQALARLTATDKLVLKLPQKNIKTKGKKVVL